MPKGQDQPCSHKCAGEQDQACWHRSIGPFVGLNPWRMAVWRVSFGTNVCRSTAYQTGWCDMLCLLYFRVAIMPTMLKKGLPASSAYSFTCCVCQQAKSIPKWMLTNWLHRGPNGKHLGRACFHSSVIPRFWFVDLSVDS